MGNDCRGWRMDRDRIHGLSPEKQGGSDFDLKKRSFRFDHVYRQTPGRNAISYQQTNRRSHQKTPIYNDRETRSLETALETPILPEKR